jgi:hypothetical protein
VQYPAPQAVHPQAAPPQQHNPQPQYQPAYSPTQFRPAPPPPVPGGFYP